MNARPTSIDATSHNNCKSAEHAIASAAEGGTGAILERLNVLEQEWSSGQLGKLTAVAVIAAGFASIGSDRIRRLLLLAGSGILAHSLITRRGVVDRMFEHLGFRPHSEIACEKLALRALRGDFHGLPTLHDVENREEIDRFEGEGGMVRAPEDSKLGLHEAAKELLATVPADAG
ncbi:MAG: hypothetical protein ACJ8C4_17655 [Gemmataceae bacterium]